MDKYRQNVKWLLWFAPFRSLSISAAYLTPFFQHNGLGLTQILALQSVFSVALLLWELPSGWIADKLGRAFSIKLSAPIAAAAMVAYGFSTQYWQFVCAELALALSYGLLSGIDTALLQDSLRAEGLEGKQLKNRFTEVGQRMDALQYASTALGVPVAWFLASHVSLSSTLVADGLLTAAGLAFAFRLHEAPRYNGSQEELRLSAWHAMRRLAGSSEARWLVLLGAVLYTATLVAFWMSAPYYQQLGIPVALFSAILALRSLWKAWLAHRFRQRSHVERNMFGYAALAGLVYLAMASGQLWLVPMVLGHDAVQALSRQPITAKLNEHFVHEYRATMNSMVNLAQRLLFSVAGPAVGWLADRYGLHVSFMVNGIAFSSACLVALMRLRQHRTFAEGG